MKKFLVLASAVVMVLGAVPAMAETTAEEIDPDEEISLTIDLDEDMYGVGVQIVRIADVEVDVGVAIYTALVGDVDYDGMTARENEDTAAELAEMDLSELTTYDGTTNTRGAVTFEDLEAGAYLVVQTSGEADFVFEPFIAFAPQCGEDTTWTYAVTAYPKTGELADTVISNGSNSSKSSGDSGSSEVSNSGSVKTGDDMSIPIYTMIACIAGAVLAGTEISRRRRCLGSGLKAAKQAVTENI